MNDKKGKMVEFTISRFDPQRNRRFLSSYKVPVHKGMTILEALQYIRDNLDETLAFRHSCRMGICGSCGINVNGKPMLACYTQILKLESDSVELEPLSNMPVIKDLVVDIQPFFETYKRMEMILAIDEKEMKASEEYIQTPSELQKYWDLTLCISCSICYSSCPAVLDRNFLGPSALTSNYRFIMDSRDRGSGRRLDPMLNNIWLCTQCNSCSLFCPKALNCADAIVDNHSLIIETGNIPRTVKDVLENVYKHHNPMGMAQAKRIDWAKDLNIKIYPETTEADVLLFVCCSNAYDPRNHDVARNMAAIFNTMGLSFVTLGLDEWCCGDHVLRMGEKGLFEELAEHNISMFRKLDTKKIVTLSPHCYNTFKNDKPYKNAGLNVQHYTQFLAEALETQSLKLSRLLKRAVVYHDACFLGKRNDIFEEPRRILEAMTERRPLEMKRTRQSSFCCGGGSGRAWTEDAVPEKRPSTSRINEALDMNVDTVAVACPYCVTMLEDAVKALDVESKIAVKDILELLKEAV